MIVVALVLATALTAASGATPSARAFATNAIEGQGNRSGLELDVQTLASDATQGRDNGTPGSFLAQRFLIDQLKAFAVGLNTSRAGDDAFKQLIVGGTNILGLIRGGELSDEYVIVGAHYDHLGSSCRSAVSGDHICNGATDNAAGVAEVLSIGREIAQRPKPPRRSVILALWDREEDGLLGSRYYVQHSLRPLAQTVAYVNYDIQGANVLPSLRADTFAIGSETGGPQLQSIVARAGSPGPLGLHSLSSIFGQYRSDYVNFISAGIPTVFFSDATGPCYHTAQDEIGVVDFWKLRFQAKIGFDAVHKLVEGDRMPFSAANPIATFEDAEAINDVGNRAIADIGRFDPSQQTVLLQFHDALNAIVAAGPANFGDDDVGTLLSAALNFVNIVSSGQCDGFLEGR
ncbi:MAG: M28 family peptidase [Actinomycetota bacterium]|nr:M28 family peptidase [Actinomycetota bacterium]